MAQTVDLKNALLNQNHELILTRREKFYLRYQMLSDNFEKQILHKLKKIYSKVAELKIDQQIDSTNNVFTTIVEEISRVYAFGVVREFSNETTQEMYDTLNITKLMKQANIYLNALNDVLLQVTWNEKTNMPMFVFRLPHKTEVVLDEYDQPKEVEYLIEKLDDGEKWAYWSNQEHYYKIYDNTGEFEKVAIEGNDQMLNPYGVLPFVFMQKGFRDGNFFDMYAGDDITNITIDNGVYSTFRNYLIKNQSFIQMFVSGSNVSQLSGQALDPTSPLTAEGEDINVQLLDLQANIKELQEVLTENVEKVALNYNISPSAFNMSSQVTSGFSKMMENYALDKDTREQQADFVMYEKELFNLMVIVAQTNNVSLDGDFSITIQEPNYPESRSTQLDAYEKEINLGLTNPVKIIQEEQNVDEEQATEIYKENIELRNEANEQFNTPRLSINTTANALLETEGN